MLNLTLENLKPYNQVSGIYKITINDKFYIGSSNNFYHRLKTHL
jgi:predicted GIY-YIG superfamily endonuclease